MKLLLVLYLVGFLRLSCCVDPNEEEPEDVSDHIFEDEIVQVTPLYNDTDDNSVDLSPLFVSFMNLDPAQGSEITGTADGVEYTKFFYVGAPDPPPALALDLTRPSDFFVTSTRHHKNGVNQVNYFPPRGLDVKLVLEGGRQVWKAQFGEACLHAETHTGDTSSFLLLCIEKDNHIRKEHFEKTSKGWISITKEEYSEKLSEIVGPPEDALP
ncbi:signal peptide-containing protein [Theileria equi strain WA]|uniref:Signal peptide-containing protein n=1 Tax=Theileria equi strain WA TaxID=1537102 RepID=L0AVZ4_THEEQ|nr:signal peptide-containing protein [Theileria equi strain WA]AFZ79388.1 signal peptide-containing protein [Theileria equi strain WA]|eukprot:XP_004829054.1 signal peptide-containing protein [Theileria equi strain WA]